MSKKCAKCEKSVYPQEELNCLDKCWHKACFKCWECGMALNMKNYKGYDKKPYCSAHYPQTKATVVADTPEMKRVQQNAKMQSQAVYHADFIKSIGTVTSMPTDPETERVKKMGNVISQAGYTRGRADSDEPDTGMNYTRPMRAPSQDMQSPPVSYEQQDNRASGGERRYQPPQNQYAPQARMLPLPGQSQPPAPTPAAPQPRPSGAVYQAMYDYDAQDEDEVSFHENDLIINCEVIDEGWMHGTVQSTGKRGMLPANYVEQVQ